MKRNLIKNIFSRRLTGRFIIGAGFVLMLAFAFFLLRGPHLSNAIKRAILPVLEDATGKRIIIDRAVINFFPFSLQAKRLKIFDEEGNQLLWVRTVRAYIDFISLLSGDVRIQRLMLKEPVLSADREALEAVSGLIDRETTGEKARKSRIALKSIKIINGRFHVTDEEKEREISGKGLQVEIALKDKAYAHVLLEDATMRIPGFHEIQGKLNGKIEADDKKIRFEKIGFQSVDSSLAAEGEMILSPAEGEKQGYFTGGVTLTGTSLQRIFGLAQTRESDITVTGTVDLISAAKSQRIPEKPQVRVDLKTKGWFYLETLMELVKVDETITGRIALNGDVKGIYPDVTGSARIDARNLILDTLPLDDLEGDMQYENNKFTLHNITAHMYGGELSGSAFIFLPDGHFIIEAGVADVDSPEFFQFIRWEPPFSAGKVGGTFTLDKAPETDIMLVANAEYVNTTEEKDDSLEGRLRKVQTEITLQEGILGLRDAALTTDRSALYLDGDIDLKHNTLSLDLEMDCKDSVDLTSPWYRGLRAPLKVTGKAEGSPESPEITGTFKIGAGTVNGEPLTEAAGDFIYSPDVFVLELLRVQQGEGIYEATGSIAFRKSTGLFSFADPLYRAEAYINRGNIQSILRTFYRELPVAGHVEGTLSFAGDRNEFTGRGDIKLEESEVYGQKIGVITATGELSPEGIHFPSVEVSHGESSVAAKGFLNFDKKINIEMYSEGITLKNIPIFDKYSIDGRMKIDLRGSGTLENPDLIFSADILESYFQDASMGKGKIHGSLKNSALSFDGNVLDGRTAVEANLDFSQNLSWNLGIELKKNKYDFLLKGFFENVPDDSSVTLEGKIMVRGEGKKVSLQSRFGSLGLNLYGYNLRNREEIALDLIDKKLSIGSLLLRGKNGDVSTAGTIEIGERYDVSMKGMINLTPLTVLSKDIETLKGEGAFTIALSGPWESPELRGEVHVSDGSLLLSDFPYRIGPVNGDIFLDREKITFDSFQTDFAGGRIFLSGVGYLKKLSMQRLSLFSKVEGITIRPLDGFQVALDGDLFFEKSPKQQSLMGDILIREARYTKRFDWKSGLLKLKQAGAPSVEQQPSFFDKTSLNLFIKGEDDIIIDNNIAQSPLNIDLNVRGTASQYGILGRVEARGGTVFFRGNEFEIVHGSVDFVESTRIAPAFQIESEAFIKGYRIRLSLDGPADELTLTLFSDPQLPDSDILALITSGNISEGTEGIEGGIGAGEATAFLTGQLQDVLEERVKYITGFERFEIDPHTTSTGAVSSKVTVGKEIVDGKLFVTYSSSVGSTELDVIKLQYNLTNNISLIGQRDQVGSVGGDIRYRFEFK